MDKNLNNQPPIENDVVSQIEINLNNNKQCNHK